MKNEGSTDEQPVRKERSRGDSNPASPPDGGWGWVVTMATFFISMVVDGVSGSYGIFYPYFLNAFGESKGKTQSVNSVMYGTVFLIAPFTGVLMKKFGARKVVMTGGFVSSLGYFLSSFSQSLDILILLQGFVVGFGMSLFYPTSLVVVTMYFEKRRAFATGIAVCGSGVGALAFAPICEFLLRFYGWRGTIWIMSGVIFNTVVCGALYRSVSERVTSGNLESSEKKISNGMNQRQNKIISTCSKAYHLLTDIFGFALLSNPIYAMHLLSAFLYLAGYLIPFSYLPAQAMSIQISSQESALLISIIGISTTIFRVLVGFVSDRQWANSFFMYSVMLMIGGICTCIVPFCTFYMLLVYSAVYGAVTATFASLMTVNLVKLVGLQRLSSSLGIQLMCMGFGLLLGSPIAGVLADRSGNYVYTFYFGGCVIGLAGLVSLPLNWMRRRNQKQNCNLNEATRLNSLQEKANVTLESINQLSEISAEV